MPTRREATIRSANGSATTVWAMPIVQSERDIERRKEQQQRNPSTR